MARKGVRRLDGVLFRGQGQVIEGVIERPPIDDVGRFRRVRDRRRQDRSLAVSGDDVELDEDRTAEVDVMLLSWLARPLRLGVGDRRSRSALGIVRMVWSLYCLTVGKSYVWNGWAIKSALYLFVL